MEPLFILLVPIVVSVLTQVVKSIEVINIAKPRVAILRFTALTLSFLGVVGVAIASGESVDPTQINIYAEAVVAFSATQIAYRFGRAS